MTAAASTPVRHELLTAPVTVESVERVKMLRVELSPGQTAGRHLHPCPVVGLVPTGSIRFQAAGEPETKLTPGQAFHEPARIEIPHFDNASKTEPAAFLARNLLAPGADRLIEMLD